MTKRAPKETIIENEPVPVAASIASASDRMLAVIDKASTDTRCNVEKMRALLDMKMELLRDERRMAYNIAMKEAQQEMQPVVRRAQNEKKRYAKLEHIDNAIRPIYVAHGFSLSFNTRKEADSTITGICDILHESGHQEQKELNAARDLTGSKGSANKTDVQGVGSTISYLRRYLTIMVFNIILIDEDDDGQGKVTGGGPTPDKFTELAQQQAAKPATPAVKNKDPKSAALDAAQILRAKMIGAGTKERRGEILMQNIKILKALDEANLTELSNEIRQLAEREQAHVGQ